MVSSNKVLTVSYGTFSCTLEGFDDSFDTMKAIAEYFRDLAADDRYFGAEPPTPDADMLARIAEREISRQVKAREEGGQIVLRAGDGTAAQATHPAPADGSGAARPSADPDHPEADRGGDTTHPAALESAPEEPAGADAGRAPADAEAQARDAGQDIPEVPARVPDREELEEPPATPALASDSAPDTAGSDAPAATEEPDDVSPADAPRAEPMAPLADTAEEDGDSVSARLRRIRSVVATSGHDDDSEDFSEDEHANDFLTRTAADLTSALEMDTANEPAGQQAVEATEPEPEPEPEQPRDPFADLTARLLEEDTPATPESPRATADAAGDDADDETAEMTGQSDAATALEDTLSQLLADAMPDDSPADTPAPARPDTAEPDDAAGAQDAAETPTPSDADSAADAADAILSPEEEAELQQELAAVEAELGGDPAGPGNTDETTADEAPADTAHDETAHEDTAHEKPAGEEAERRGTRLTAAEEDADLSRLFEEADSQLQTPESSKRRNAIQHLRAAVAATKAEKTAGSELRADQNDAPYRSDLEQAVRPRRPRPGNEPAQSERRRGTRPAAEDRPAPLKLVAEQRVDTTHEPVRPRRVSAPQPSTADSGAGSGDTGFEDYARDIGATTLPDLLEAAAAYMADVEGRDQFSRPMLMGKIKEVEQERFTREDGLRSFGHLLRQGKLQKLKGGRFAVTETTEFRAAARQAG